MAPTLADKVPTGDGWVHEIKHDGYRMLAFIEDGKVRLLSRRRYDWTKRLSIIADALKPLAHRQAIIDGEVAAPDETGVTRASDMRDAIHRKRHRLAYFAFDLLWIDGTDLRRKTLLERKRALRSLLRPAMKTGRVFYVDHLEGLHGQELYRRLVALGGEGVVSKEVDAPYQSGPTRRWLKIKTDEVRERQAEAVRAQFYREIEPEAAADLERLGIKGRLFPTGPTERAAPAKRKPKLGDKDGRAGGRR
jgi:bifunctional non-homologous end joining protein LigD